MESCYRCISIIQRKNEKKGLEDFLGKTATMDIVSYNVYEVENVLIFYVYRWISILFS
jgi:hypothetical protein